MAYHLGIAHPLPPSSFANPESIREKYKLKVLSGHLNWSVSVINWRPGKFFILFNDTFLEEHKTIECGLRISMAFDGFVESK